MKESTAAEKLFGLGALLTAPFLLTMPSLAAAIPLGCMLGFGIARLFK